MIALYHILFYKPLFNGLIFLYKTVAFHDLGIAIVLLTVLIRLILFPLFQKSVRHQTIMQELQPKLKKIQADHRHDMERQSRETMALYREHKINPFFGFFLLLVQLPILIALYQIFLTIVTPQGLGDLYSFLHAPERLTTSFLGLIPLEKMSILIAGCAALAQYVQGRMSLRQKKGGEELSKAEKMSRRMVLLAPLITIAVFARLPAAVGLYWLTTSLFSILQQYIVNKELHNGNNGTVGTAH